MTSVILVATLGVFQGTSNVTDTLVMVQSIELHPRIWGVVRSLDFGSGGRMVIAEAREPRIWIVDHAGKVLDSLGRQGQGPGEFLRLERAGWRGDTVWATDQQQGRLTTFVPTGRGWSAAVTTIRDVARSPSEGGVTSRLTPAALIGNGAVLVFVPPSPLTLKYQATEGLSLVSRSLDGNTRRTLTTLKMAHVVFQIRRPNGEIVVPEPWPDHDMWDLSANGRYLAVVRRSAGMTGEGGGYLVEVVGTEGVVVWRESFDHRVRPLKRAEAHRWASMKAKEVEPKSAAMQAALAEELWRNAYKPKVVPPVLAVLSGIDGSVWILEDRPNEPAWGILYRGKRLHGGLSFPEGMKPLVADRRSVWGVITSPEGAQRLIHMRVSRVVNP